MSESPLVSVVLPCLDEADAIAECVLRAFAALEAGGLSGEVIVVDNGSQDDSAALARAAGATVVHEPRRGYGRALRSGFTAARGDFVVMADADLSYPLSDIPRFIEELTAGADLVMGNRLDAIAPGSMPW